MKVKILKPICTYPSEKECEKLEEQGIYPGTIIGMEWIEIEVSFPLKEYEDSESI